MKKSFASMVETRPLSFASLFFFSFPCSLFSLFIFFAMFSNMSRHTTMIALNISILVGLASVFSSNIWTFAFTPLPRFCNQNL